MWCFPRRLLLVHRGKVTQPCTWLAATPGASPTHSSALQIDRVPCAFCTPTAPAAAPPFGCGYFATIASTPFSKSAPNISDLVGTLTLFSILANGVRTFLFFLQSSPDTALLRKEKCPRHTAGFVRKRECPSSIDLAHDGIDAARCSDDVGDELTHDLMGQAREVVEGGRADAAAVRRLAALGHDVEAELALRNLGGRGRSRPSGHAKPSVTIMNWWISSSMLVSTFVFVGRKIFGSSTLTGPSGISFERLVQDPDRLAHLLDAHEVAVVDVPFRSDRARSNS